MNRLQIAQMLSDLNTIAAAAGSTTVTGTVAVDGFSGAITATGAMPISSSSALTVKGSGPGDAVVIYSPSALSVSGTVNVGTMPNVTIGGTVGSLDVNVASQAVDLDVVVTGPLDTGAVAVREQAP